MDTEQGILKTLHYQIDTPTAHASLMRILLAEGYDPKMVQMSRYLLDSTLLSYDLLSYYPSQLAAAVVYIARRTIWGEGWSEHLGAAEDEILPVARAVLDAKAELTQRNGLRQKYSSAGVYHTVFPCDL